MKGEEGEESERPKRSEEGSISLPPLDEGFPRGDRQVATEGRCSDRGYDGSGGSMEKAHSEGEGAICEDGGESLCRVQEGKGEVYGEHGVSIQCHVYCHCRRAVLLARAIRGARIRRACFAWSTLTFSKMALSHGCSWSFTADRGQAETAIRGACIISFSHIVREK